MKMKHSALFVAFVIAAVAHATDYYVATDGSDSNDGLSWNSPFATLAKAYSTAPSGSTVILGDGTFTLSSTVTLAKSLTITSANGNTILSGGGTCLPLTLNFASCVVSNLTIADGYNTGRASNNWNLPPASGVCVKSGLLVDCVVTNGSAKTGTAVSAVTLNSDSAIVERCRIVGNSAGRNTTAYGAVAMSDGGTVLSCEIAYNKARGAAGVYIIKGPNCFVQDCFIHDNSTYAADELEPGVTVGMAGAGQVHAGILERCTIVSNSAVNGAGAIRLRDGAILRNSLIAFNTTSGGNGGGVLYDGGSSANLLNCTVYGNTAPAGTGAGVYVSASSGNFQNNIVWGNGNDTSKEVSTTVNWSYSTAPTAIGGTGNQTSDPLLANPTRGDFDLLASSPAIDSAATVAAITDDLLGTERPQDGDNNGTAAYDRGCIEHLYTSSASIAIGMENGAGVIPLDVTFYPVFNDGEDDGYSYVWDFGDGSTETITSTKAFVHTYTSPGVFSIALTITDARGNAVGDDQILNAVHAVSPVVYVSPDGSATWPYATAATAATVVPTALDVLENYGVTGGVVRILPGTYTGTVSIASANTIVGVGDLGACVISGGGATLPLVMNHVDAVVTNLAIRDGCVNGTTADYAAAPSGVSLAKGQLLGCEVSGCTPATDTSAQAVVVGETDAVDFSTNFLAVMAGCIVTNNSNFYLNRARAGGVYVVDYALVRDCEISGNRAVSAGGVACFPKKSMSTVLGCDIHDNEATTGSGGGLMHLGGRVERCVFRDNVSGGSAGGVRISQQGYKASFVNCVVYGNSSGAEGGGISSDYGSSLRIVHCTLAGNTSGSHEGDDLYLKSGDFINSIVAGTDASTCVSWDGGVISNVCIRGTSLFGITGNSIFADPMFVDEEAGDFRLQFSSPCIDMGKTDEDASDDMVGTARPIDWEGNGSALPDLGAYEMTAYEGGAAAAFMLDKTSGICPANVTFTGTLLGGAPSGETTFIWDFGDGTTSSATNAMARHTYAAPGVYDVTLRIVDVAQSIDASFAKSSAMYVLTTNSYVSHTGSATFPYDTPEKATPSIAAAANATRHVSGSMAGIVHIAAGTYAVSCPIRPSYGLRFVGEGADRTVVSGGGTASGIFTLSHSSSGIEGLALCDTTAYLATLSNGEIVDCVLSNCVSSSPSIAAHALVMSGTSPRASRLLIEGNVSCTVDGSNSTVTATGGGVYMAGGTLSDSVIRGNRAYAGGGVYAYGGMTTISNCVVIGNRAEGGSQTGCSGGGIFATGPALVLDTAISGNYAYSTGAGAYLSSVNKVLPSPRMHRCKLLANTNELYTGVLRLHGGAVAQDCLAAENVSLKAGSGVYMDGDTSLINCTFVKNHSAAYSAISMAGGTNVNCISWGNTVDDNSSGCGPDIRVVEGSAVVISHFCSSREGVEGDGNFTADPRLRADYSLKRSSPCIDAGDVSLRLFPSEAGTDLGGSPRVQLSGLDLGCYESDGKVGGIYLFVH